MSVCLYGQQIQVPNTACWLDPPDVVKAVSRGRGTRIPKSTEGYRRSPEKDWVHGHVTHTTSGTVTKLDTQASIDSSRDWSYAMYDERIDDKSWSVTKDTDESAIQICDPGEIATWHAGRVNIWTDGWELVQTASGTLTQAQLDGYVRLCDEWSYHCGIPRIIAWRNGAPFLGMLTRALAAYGGGHSLCCFYGHCNIWSLTKAGRLTSVRGHGDPSHLPFEALAKAGYMKLDVEKNEDLEMFKDLQSSMLLEPDGVCGPGTRAALIHSGKYGTGGMLITRPGDDQRGTPAWVKKRSSEWRRIHGV